MNWQKSWHKLLCRFLSPRHEAREFAVHGSRAGQNRRFWTGQRDTLQASLHRLRINQMVRALSRHRQPFMHRLQHVRASSINVVLFLRWGIELQRSCSGHRPTALLLTCGLSAALWLNSTHSDRFSPGTVKWMRSSRSAKSWELSKRWEEAEWREVGILEMIAVSKKSGSAH